MAARLTILRGLPGAGKSTLAEKLVREGKADVFFEADQFFVKDGVYTFDVTKLGAAHKWCQDSVRFALYEGKSVVVSNTSTTKWELEPYMKMAEALGIPVEVVTLTTQFGSVHGVPPEVVERMSQRWEACEGEKFVGA